MTKIKQFKFKDEELEESYTYFKTLLSEHTPLVNKQECMIAASDIALLKNRLKNIRKEIPITYKEVLNIGVEVLVDLVLATNHLTLDESIELEQLILRAREILIEEQKGEEYYE